MNEDEQDDFQHESLGGDGMNLLGKAGGEGAELGFDVFANVLNQKGLGRVVGAFAV